MRKTKGKHDIGRKSDRDSLFLRMLAAEKIEISDEAMAYFRKYPDEVDEVTAPTRVHMFFLWVGIGIGMLAVALSKIVAALPFDHYLGESVETFVVEIIFESGIALIGAALTAYFLGVLLNAQQERARAFRKEIRRRLRKETA